ncbi:MAG TPA: hypothetical protein VGH24_10290 [Solirubrobacteraceae bacterium]|jgi:hypothetical protein
MRKRVALGAIPVGMAILGMAGSQVAAARPAAETGTASTVPDVTVLFGRAVTKIRSTTRPTYARAVVLEADGITAGGRCTPFGCSGGRGTTSASGFVSWRFVFNNASWTRFKSATLTYGPPPKAFGPVRGFKESFAGDVNIPRAPRMTLSQAVALLRSAGHRAKFFNVTLRNPLGPKRLNPQYIFGFDHNEYFAVDTVTKKVRPFS